jgi:hypothetical protein
VLLTYIQSYFCSSEKLVVVVYVGIVCVYVCGTFCVICYVATVGIMVVVLLVLLVIFYISGFYPPCAMMRFCCCLIFFLGANIFIAKFSLAYTTFFVSYFGSFACYSAIYLFRISSADSFMSAASYIASSFPLIVA